LVHCKSVRVQTGSARDGAAVGEVTSAAKCGSSSCGGASTSGRADSAGGGRTANRVGSKIAEFANTVDAVATIRAGQTSNCVTVLAVGAANGSDGSVGALVAIRADSTLSSVTQRVGASCAGDWSGGSCGGAVETSRARSANCGSRCRVRSSLTSDAVASSFETASGGSGASITGRARRANTITFVAVLTSSTHDFLVHCLGRASISSTAGLAGAHGGVDPVTSGTGETARTVSILTSSAIRAGSGAVGGILSGGARKARSGTVDSGVGSVGAGLASADAAGANEGRVGTGSASDRGGLVASAPVTCRALGEALRTICVKVTRRATSSTNVGVGGFSSLN
jgi:hypothetical protein